MVYSLFWVLQDLYHQPLTLNHIDPLKEPLQSPLIDPFKKEPQDFYHQPYGLRFGGCRPKCQNGPLRISALSPSP